MKLTLTTYGTGHDCYKDVRRAEFGINCPYAIKVQWRRYCLTLYRWGHLAFCISKDNSDQPRGGDMENWAEWVMWQDNPFGKFRFWKLNGRSSRNKCPILNPVLK